MWSRSISPDRKGMIRSPASASVAARESTMTRARRTVVASISCISGVKEPMPLTWVPGRRSRPSKTGVRDVVAAQTMSASASAARGLAAMTMSLGMGP